MGDKQFPTYEQLQQGWLQIQAERDQYKIWWERDSRGLGTTLNELSILRFVKQDQQAQIKRLTCDLETVKEYADTQGKRANRLRDERDLLLVLVRKALYAWEGTGPPLVLDELRKALGVPVIETAEHCLKCGERTDTYPVGSYHKCEATS